MVSFIACIFTCFLIFEQKTVISGHKTSFEHDHDSNYSVSNLTWAQFHRGRLYGRIWDRVRLQQHNPGSSSERSREEQICPQCPPIPPPVQCPPAINYDKNYQAATLEEAMLNFQDLTLPDPKGRFRNNFRLIRPTQTVGGFGRRIGGGGAGKPGGSPGQPPAPAGFVVTDDESGACGSDDSECQACTCAMLTRVGRAGLIDSARRSSHKSDFEQRLGLNCSRVARVPCDRYRFANRNIKKVRKLAVAPELEQFTVKSVPKVEALRKSIASDVAKLAPQFKTFGAPPPAAGASRGPVPVSLPFDAPPDNQVMNDIQGERKFDIACVKRGDPETESVESWVIMCDMCWSWRVLPQQYFPRYINELRCSSSNSDSESGENEGKCLGKLGECQQREKTMTVQRNLGTLDAPDWQPVDITTSTCCDCKVLSGSPMHGFVQK